MRTRTLWRHSMGKPKSWITLAGISPNSFSLLTWLEDWWKHWLNFHVWKKDWKLTSPLSLGKNQSQNLKPKSSVLPKLVCNYISLLHLRSGWVERGILCQGFPGNLLSHSCHWLVPLISHSLKLFKETIWMEERTKDKLMESNWMAS